MDQVLLRLLPPDQIREQIRKRRAEGADLIKIFASASIRDGGTPTLSQEQLDAACGEARAQGLASLRGSSWGPFLLRLGDSVGLFVDTLFAA